jgi:hypothetical protein
MKSLKIITKSIKKELLLISKKSTKTSTPLQSREEIMQVKKKQTIHIVSRF